jgi:hypothetical protein
MIHQDNSKGRLVTEDGQGYGRSDEPRRNFLKKITNYMVHLKILKKADNWWKV